MAQFNDLHVRSYAPVPADALSMRNGFVHNWFSNFDKTGFPVEYRGRKTMVLELAFVAAKNPDAVIPVGTDLLGDRTIPFIDRVFACKTPGEAKRIGSARARGGLVDLRADWDEVNIAAMDYFLRQRWQPGTPDANRLAAMVGPIIEVNNWRDNRWGVTTKDWKGRNALGLLLDVIAEENRAGYVRPGTSEEMWASYQAELIAGLNGRVSGIVIEAPRQQMTMF